MSSLSSESLFSLPATNIVEKSPSIILLSGAANVGKSTIANYLVKYRNYNELTFSSLLKDVVSTLFSWNRDRLDGLTEEDRLWREKEDEKWTVEFGFVITPRKMLQKIGTDLFRNGLHKNVWIILLLGKIEEILRKGKKKIVISDARFLNEIESVKKKFPNQTRSFLIERPRLKENLLTISHICSVIESSPMKASFDDYMDLVEEETRFHRSEFEWYWIKKHQPELYDEVISNDSSLDELISNFKKIM